MLCYYVIKQKRKIINFSNRLVLLYCHLLLLKLSELSLPSFLFSCLLRIFQQFSQSTKSHLKI